MPFARLNILRMVMFWNATRLASKRIDVEIKGSVVDLSGI